MHSFVNDLIINAQKTDTVSRTKRVITIDGTIEEMEELSEEPPHSQKQNQSFDNTVIAEDPEAEGAVGGHRSEDGMFNFSKQQFALLTNNFSCLNEAYIF